MKYVVFLIALGTGVILLLLKAPTWLAMAMAWFIIIGMWIHLGLVKGN